jgi:hypothetical protein
MFDSILGFLQTVGYRRGPGAMFLVKIGFLVKVGFLAHILSALNLGVSQVYDNVDSTQPPAFNLYSPSCIVVRFLGVRFLVESTAYSRILRIFLFEKGVSSLRCRRLDPLKIQCIFAEFRGVVSYQVYTLCSKSLNG